MAGYLKRDLEDAGYYLADTGEDLGKWLRFDLELVESRLAEAFLSVADRTRVEMAKLNAELEYASHWHTGEITGIGTLRCTECGEELHFKHTGHIPPCPKCRGTLFDRVKDIFN